MRKALLISLAVLAAASLQASIAAARTGISVGTTNSTATMPRMSLEGGLGEPVVCSVTAATTLHSRTVKTVGTLAGNANITVGTGACSSGNAGLLVGGSRVTGARGPYHITYQSFTGTLPNITSVTLRLNDVSFWIDIGGIVCLSNGAIDINGTTTGGNPATGISVTAQNAPLTGGFLCLFASGSINGSGSLSASIRMTLF